MDNALPQAPANAPGNATDEAIDWLVLLRSGEATAAERSAFDDWLNLHPAHRLAWQRLAAPVDGAFAAARAFNQRAPGHADALAQALSSARSSALQRRRLLRGALAVGGVGMATALVAQRFTPLQDMLADLRTGTGERRSFELADGSQLLLNARSAVDLEYSAGSRSLRLRSGECIASVQPDALRPFSVHCRHGHAQVAAGTQGARLLLRQQDDRSLAVALQGQLVLVSVGGAQQPLDTGQAAWLSPAGITPAAAEATAASWQQGRLVVNDRPLGEVVAALRPYRAGLLRISDEAARLRVHGIYPLDDSDRALAIIGDTLPVAVHVHSAGWLVRVERA